MSYKYAVLKYPFKTTNDIESNLNSINPEGPSVYFKTDIFDFYGVSKNDLSLIVWRGQKRKQGWHTYPWLCGAVKKRKIICPWLCGVVKRENKVCIHYISLSNFGETISSINRHHFEILLAVLSKLSKSKTRNGDRNISYNDDICV